MCICISANVTHPIILNKGNRSFLSLAGSKKPFNYDVFKPSVLRRVLIEMGTYINFYSELFYVLAFEWRPQSKFVETWFEYLSERWGCYAFSHQGDKEFDAALSCLVRKPELSSAFIQPFGG